MLPRSPTPLQGPTRAGLLYADTGGEGPVVVLLHGVLMSGSVWAEVVEHLRGNYRCVVPELPLGSHRRPMPKRADLALASMAKLVAGFLDELDLTNVTLVSNDWGGAQLVFRPGGSKRIANLVLASCEAFDNYPPGLPGRLLTLAARLPAGLYASIRLLRFRWFRNLPLAFGNMSNKPVPELLFSSWIEPALGDQAVRRDLAKYLRRVPSREQLLMWADEQRSFRGNVLVVWAGDDRLMPPAHATRLATHFENARLVWIDDSRTLIPVDQPDVLARHLRDFLETA